MVALLVDRAGEGAFALGSWFVDVGVHWQPAPGVRIFEFRGAGTLKLEQVRRESLDL
jgi:hypothetical protein